MESVIISGASGFIGRHLISCFAAHEVKVYALVSPGRGGKSRIEHYPNVSVIECDLNQWETAIPALPHGARAFICLSWSGVSPESRNDFEQQFPNVERTLNAMRLAAAVGAERFILPGSTTEYADSEGPINGDTCPSPQNMYGAVKIAARYLCKALAQELGIAFVYTVITGIYSADRKDNNVIYYAITKLLRGERASFTRLEQLWDYVHIDDVSEALYQIAEKGKPGAVYAIGHGDNWPLANYICRIRDLIDPDAELGIGDIPYKSDRIPSSCVDLSALREDTGFEPQICFEDGIQSVIAQVAEDLKRENE